MSNSSRSPGPDLLGRLYDRTLHAADWLHARRLAVGIAGAPLVTLVLASINQWVLLDFPNSGDEFAYLYQAQTLAAGRLWNTLPPAPEIFDFSYLIQEPGRMYSSFPVGWPLAMALGLRAGLPPWLVNPLLGTATLVLVWWLGVRLYAPRVGAIAAILVGVSPFFLFNAASYFSHTFCGVLVLGAAVVAARCDRTPAWVPLLTGALIGWAVLARYFTGAVCAIPIALWLLRPGPSRPRTLALFGLGGLPWALGLLAYNHAMIGNAWQLTTTPLTRSLWFADGFVLRGADILSTHLLRHLLWTPAALIVAYVVYLRAADRTERRGWLDWMPVLMVGTLYFYVERGGNQYGPRFHYEVWLFLVVFVTASLFRHATWAEASRWDRALCGLVAAGVALMPVSFVVHAAIERQVIRERMDPFIRARDAGLQNALVLIGGRVGQRRSMAARDLTRNGIEYDASVLYGLDLGEEARCQPKFLVPGRSTYVYVWDHAHGHGALSPLDCPGRTKSPK